ncbi:hypothetical protein [Chryseobacterium sp. JUb7]|uniref:hypothetical protein n=1 Tax=Chryseobacterium sp. JUb7 TaxID=2940599 RepID=UPI002168F41A|nr:hypothetical protein [Chryseobacterium sp. JUb7]MCS3532915.1 hypothetical protein [Chryseobacterium sp. JUb7]
MKKTIAAIFIIATQMYSAQQATEMQNNKYNLTIKSPDASQLSKHIDIPTTTHTGTVGIDIPIYNIKIDNYSLPISLKYHASGVKVKEIASKVGLGWSLSIGGISMSKQIIANEDKGYIPAINQADGAFQPNDRTSSDFSFASQIMGFDASDPSNTYNHLGQKRDTQPDIFSYSIPGSSGDFYLDSTGSPIKIGETSVKISKPYPFILTDDSGNIYYFSIANEMRTVGGALPTIENIVSTDFKIDKIVLPNGKEIKFEYLSTPSYKYLSSYYKGFSYPLQCQTSTDGVVANTDYNEYASLTEVLREKYLDKIIYPDGYTLFTYSNNRQDILGGLALENISVYDNSNKLIANQQLNKSYFTTDDTKNIGGYTNHTDALTKRLKLNEVKNTFDNSSYKLTYYEGNLLPNRLSDATDFVGYSNGKSNNLGIPYVALDDDIYGWGDDKNPDINFAVSGSLKELIYPTGGKMGIEYELDDFDSSYFPTETNIVQQEHMIDSNYTESIINVNTSANRVSFKVNFTSNANPLNDGSNTLPDINQPYFIAEILDNSNIVLKTIIFNGDYEFLLDKKPSYKLRIRKHKNPSADKYASFTVKFFEKTVVPNTNINKSVGGIRVKKIVKQENVNNVIEERFSYKDENGLSTGVYMGDPINYYYFASSPHGYWGETCRRLIISNSGNFNLSTINGKPTVYNKVITERVDVNNLNTKWKTVDTYYNAPSTNAYNSETPFQTFVNNQFARGLLLTKEIFDSNNNLIKKTENEYSPDNYFNQKSSDYLSMFPDVTIRPYQMKITKIVKEPCFLIPNCFIHVPTFEFTRYEITSSWMKLKMQKKTNYFNNQNIVETTNYFYNSEHKHLNPISLDVESSDGTVNKTSYSYAHEKGNQLMIDKNMTGIPLETIVLQKQNSNDAGKILSKTDTVYPTSLPTAQSGNLILPLSALSYDLQNGTTASTEITYDKYDSNGNLQQYTTKDGVSTTIIWGYNNTQPIAKIEGAKLSDIQQSFIDSIVNASNTDALAASNNDETSFLSVLNIFKNNLPNYQVSTYTYDPLIGVRSITPPSGIREVYIYDTANRLKEIRENDATGKLLKEFKYNYKN